MAYDAPATDDFDPSLPDDDIGTMPMDEVVREAIDARLLSTYVAQPGRVTAINAEQTVEVQLLLQTRDMGATAAVDRAILQRVPVAMPMGQGYSVKYPVAVGDLGLVLFADRSLDAYLASDGSQTVDPADTRAHSLNDAIFLPGLPTSSQNTTDGTTDLVISVGQDRATQLRVRDDGKFQIKNQTQELLSLVDQLATTVATLANTIATAPAITLPSTAAGPIAPALAAQLQQVAQQVQALQQNLATLKV
jgi:hypothetical protein